MPNGFKFFIGFIAFIGLAAYGNQSGWSLPSIDWLAILFALVLIVAVIILFVYQQAQMTVLARITRNQAVICEQLNNIMAAVHRLENEK